MSTEGFNRLLFVVNPTSTNCDTPLVQSQIQAVKEAYPHDYAYQSSYANPHKNAEMLYKHVADGDRIIVIGGDKTLGTTVSVLEEPEFQDRDITIVPAPGGNKFDFARSVGNTDHSLLDVIRHGQNSPVRLIEAEITDPAGTVNIQKAINTAGLGGSAEISRLSNLRAYREAVRTGGMARQTMSDLQVVYKALQGLKPFAISTPDQPDPQSRYEITFTNSTRVGGYGKPPTEASDERFYKIELANKNFWRVASLVGKLALGAKPKDPSLYLTPPQEFAFTLQDTEDIQTSVLANFDGDVIMDKKGQPLYYTKGTQFTFRHSTNSVQVVQMKPYVPKK